MIKSPQKENNAYRILKVISSQDFLATDYWHRFYILSAVEKREKGPAISLLARKSQRVQIQNRIIEAKECIQIEHMHYYVFSVGRNDLVCANSLEPIKLMSRGRLIQFFATSIRGILKFLLVRPLKECRKYLDIRNCIIIKGLMYLLELDRGKQYPRSLEKSQKLLLPFQKDSLQKQLDKQLQIIKHFGAVFWEIIFKTPFTSTAKVAIQHPVVDILKGMMSKQLTFEYLEIKVGQLLCKIENSIQRKPKKTHLSFKECGSRYQTESLCSETKANIRRVSTEGIANESSSRYRPLIEKRKKMVSEIRTGNQLPHGTHRRLVSSINSNYSNPNKFIALKNIFQEKLGRVKVRGLESLMPIKLRQKLIRQSETAQTRFSKMVELNQAVKSNREEQITQGLRQKLISRIKRIKTQTKYYETERESYSQLSHHKLQINHLATEDVCKKLEFTHSGTAQNQLLDCTSLQKLDASVLQARTTNTNAKQEERIAELPQNTKKIAFREVEGNQNCQEDIQFEVIELPQEIEITHKQSQFAKTNQIIAQETLKKVIAKDRVQTNIKCVNAAAEKQLLASSFNKKKASVAPPIVNTDEIEVIKFEKKEAQLPPTEKKIVSEPVRSSNPRIPRQAKSLTSVENAVEQFQELVNILGRVAYKSIAKSSQLQMLDWYRVAYFIYERYVYQREKFHQALALGAKQIIRTHRPVEEEQWNLWLSSEHRKEMISRVEAQNQSIKKEFDGFVTRILRDYKFQRKVEYYIRNREKYYSNFAGKVRALLSQFAAKYTIEAYDLIVQKKMGQKELQMFVWDSLFAMLAIAELDGILQESQRVNLQNYEKYSNDLEKMDEIVQCIYSLYFEERGK